VKTEEVIKLIQRGKRVLWIFEKDSRLKKIRKLVKKLNINNKIYFATYKTLYFPMKSEKVKCPYCGKVSKYFWCHTCKNPINRLYQNFPRNFFDVIVVDECSFRPDLTPILGHFKNAILTKAELN